MAVPEGGGVLGHLWGSFQAAVNDPEVRAQPGGVQQYVWQSVRNDFLSRREPLPPGSFQAVNQMLSLAGQQRRAEFNLDRAVKTYNRTGQDLALTSEHLAPDIDSRSLDQQIGGPRWRVRYELAVSVEGETVMTRFTWDPGLDVPQSISGLLSGIDEAAYLQAADYGWEYQGDAYVLSITTI